MFLFCLLRYAIWYFFNYGTIQARLKMRALVTDATARQRQQDKTDAARRISRDEKRGHRDADHLLGWLKASQGRLGSSEIEPAIAA